MAKTLNLCRKVLRELKRADPEGVGGAPWQYITSQIRQHRKVSDERVISSHQRLLQTYLSYIESSRLYRELLTRYQGKGERSIEESANLVGLQLPVIKQPETGSNDQASR